MSDEGGQRKRGRSLMAAGTDVAADSIAAESIQQDCIAPAVQGVAGKRRDEAFDQLSERQRVYLRHVAQNRRSKEIAQIEGVSPRAVDKQLILAKNLIGTATRAEAARRFIAFETGVECLHPANALPVQQPVYPLPLPVPNRRMPVNLINARAALIWTAVIGIAITIGLASAAMLINALMILFGAKST